jgi:YD repeat-containing protein
MRKMNLLLIIGALILLISENAYADTYPARKQYQACAFGYCQYYSYISKDDACSKIPSQNGYTSYYNSSLDLCYFYYVPHNGWTGAVIYTNYVCENGGSLSGTNCINAPACPTGQTRNPITGACGFSPKSNGPTCGADIGNPINAGTGNKWQHETDLPHSAFGLGFDRYYNASTTANPSNLGAGWRHAYARSSTIQASGALVTIRRNDGKEYNFKLSAGLWVADADVPDRLEELKNSAGARTGWRYTTADKSIETYTAFGQLTAIADRTGLAQTLTYSDASTPVAIAPTSGLLIRVTDSVGRQLNFTYDANSRLSTMTDPDEGLYLYAYDANNHLVSVTYPDTTPADSTDNPKKTYVYGSDTGETVNTAGISQPHALTGIIDENRIRYATYTYDAQGRAISTEHAGGADRVRLVFNADGSTTVTDALNTARTYHFQTLLGVVKPKGQSQPGGSGCGASASALTYDANGNVSSRTDFNNNRTNYSYDLTRNLETSRTEGLTATGAVTSATRTITTVWHATFRLPVQITQGNQQTTYAYNAQGDITDKTVTDLAANTSRHWHTTYTYGTVPGVLVQKVEDGPRTDVADLTTYDYYPADAACAGGHLGCRGQLKEITDALGHHTQLTRYSAHGQVEELIDPNELVTTMTYDSRQRLTSLDVGGETTRYRYNPVGLLTRVTGPDNAYLAYGYDEAHRLTQTQDNLGNTFSYTLDAMGNRTQEQAYDPGGQLARSQSRVYDALSRLQNLIQPQ